jgi:hypothetical protein
MREVRERERNKKSERERGRGNRERHVSHRPPNLSMNDQYQPIHTYYKTNGDTFDKIEPSKDLSFSDRLRCSQIDEKVHRSS